MFGYNKKLSVRTRCYGVEATQLDLPMGRRRNWCAVLIVLIHINHVYDGLVNLTLERAPEYQSELLYMFYMKLNESMWHKWY